MMLYFLTFIICALSASAWVQPLQSEENFKAYVAKFNKTYDADVYSFRLGVFQANMGRAEALGPGYGINRFADMTREEMYRFRGYVRNPNLKSAAVWESSSSSGALPRSVDWRTQGVVTPIYDQGECGSCWAFSAVEEIESMYARMTRKLVSLSVQQLNDCDAVDYGCDGGDPEDAYIWIKKNGGIASAAAYPYVSGNSGLNGKCVKGVASTVSIKSYTWAVDPCNSGACNKQNETKMLQAVAEVGPLSICVDAADDWFLYTSGDYKGACSARASAINHCVQVVGYGTNDNGSQYWIVRNTWSVDWGEAGYMRIPVGSNKCSVASEVSYVTPL